MSQKIIVIGGGITGLSAVFYLQQSIPNAEITLIERDQHLGGKILTEEVDGFVIEGGADSFLSRKLPALELCRALGIEGRLQGRVPENKKTFVQRWGTLHRLPEGLTGMIPTDLVGLEGNGLISAETRHHLAQEHTIPARTDDADESIAAFITRRLGQETFENLVEPLMGGIYAGQADQLSILATFPQLRRIEREHGSLLNGLRQQTPRTDHAYPPFISFSQGMGELVTALTAQLDDVTIMKQTEVTRVARGEGQVTSGEWQVDVTDLDDQSNATLSADALIFATPAYVTGRLLANYDSILADALTAIPYASVALVTVGFDEQDVPPLQGYGYVIPRVEGKDVLACTWSSRKWAGRAPEGKVLLRVYLGRYGQDVTTHSDDHLLQVASAELKTTLGIEATPLLQRVHRWKRAMPQYTLGHLERVNTITTQSAQHPTLAIAGAFLDGVGVPDCVRQGRRAAEGIKEVFTTESAERKINV